MKKNIILTGFMGSGKTTVGKLAAERLNLCFVDIDAMIEQQHGMNISDIFAQKGERYFREIESKAVEKISLEQNAIISTGGGVVLKEENIFCLRRNGIIVYLKADVDTIMRNTSQNSNRPLLKDTNPKVRIQQLLEQREAYYKHNDYEIDVSSLTIEQVVSAVLNIYHKEQAN
ncbi:MAG: shikimate kinase [Clostridia bacterium]